MGKDPQIGLSVKELKNYVIRSEVPQGTTTYYKNKASAEWENIWNNGW